MNKISLNSNQLKIIAIITMIIDHIGYYFSFVMTDNLYLIFRAIGRISMPIFVFLIVQGYFKTSNFKKYIIRLFLLAIITQIIISLAYMININFVPDYSVGIYAEYNILFSFVLSLFLIYIIDKKTILSKSLIINIINKILIIFLISIIYILNDIDYGFIIPIMTIGIYINEILNQNNKITRNILLFLIIFMDCMLQGYIGLFAILSVIFISLYSGKLGKKSNLIRKTFYFVFPIQHFILYLMAMMFFVK